MISGVGCCNSHGESIGWNQLDIAGYSLDELCEISYSEKLETSETQSFTKPWNFRDIKYITMRYKLHTLTEVEKYIYLYMCVHINVWQNNLFCTASFPNIY